MSGAVGQNGALDKQRLKATAFVFRGYNITNLGRIRALAHPAYGPVVEPFLREAGAVCGDVIGRKVDLVQRVRQRQETSLDTYCEAVALIVAMELAQFGSCCSFLASITPKAEWPSDIASAKLRGLLPEAYSKCAMPCASRWPLREDCAELAANTTLGVLFCADPRSTWARSSGFASGSTSPGTA